MNRLQQAIVWLSRIGHCKGFGIQSPTDFRFVREVVNEPWPYYAYAETGKGDGWMRRKLGRLYMRLANYAQPAAIADMLGYAEYLHAGCRKAAISKTVAPQHQQMILAPATADVTQLIGSCSTASMLVLEDIAHHRRQWQQVLQCSQATITYDLYYCGIAIFNEQRAKQNYKVNF